MKDELLFNDRYDELGQLLKDPHKKSRHDIWLWLYLDNHNARFPPASCNGLTMRDEIAKFLKHKPAVLKKIASKKDEALVPDAHLEWIGEGARQYRWLLGKIEDITGASPSWGQPHSLVHLTGRNHLIAMLDLWSVDLENKADQIERLRNQWLRHKAKDSDFEWFKDKKEGLQRCRCAREWLEKNPINILKSQPPISNYEELLMYFDELGPGHNEKKAIIEKIKKRWHRKQFNVREADKKQVNVMLSKTVIILLDELAKKHNLKRGKVLEQLIEMESSQSRIVRAQASLTEAR
ncbi:hypothetical protein F3K50_17180 [Pseudomonas marginalis]|nr:hypothetical protein F3K50_17180 [Pseudomonas marginalis]